MFRANKGLMCFRPKPNNFIYFLATLNSYVGSNVDTNIYIIINFYK